MAAVLLTVQAREALLAAGASIVPAATFPAIDIPCYNVSIPPDATLHFLVELLDVK
jgi:hypothetical protein